MSFNLIFQSNLKTDNTNTIVDTHINKQQKAPWDPDGAKIAPVDYLGFNMEENRCLSSM